MKITNNFTLEELCYSLVADKKGIENYPNAQQKEAIEALAKNVLQPIRDFIGVPLHINSCFRSEKLNKLISKVPTSYHLATRGIAAADISCQRVELKVIFKYIKENLDFHELIWEYGNSENPKWIHVAFNSSGKNNKKIIYVK